MVAMDEFVEEKDLKIADLNYSAPERHDEGHIGGLAESIALCGLLHPIVVHPVENGRYSVDAGTGRIHAHLFLGKKRIRARVYTANPPINRLRHIDENLQRVANDFEWDKLIVERLGIIKKVDPKGKALQGCFDRLEEFPVVTKTKSAESAYAPRQIQPTGDRVLAMADDIGVSRRSVAQSAARINNSAPEVLAAYQNEDLKKSQVDELVKICNPEAQAKVLPEVLGKSVQATRDIVRAVLAAPVVDEPSPDVAKDATTVAEEATPDVSEESHRLERLTLVKDLAWEFREALHGLYSDEDRLEVLEVLGVCFDCGVVLQGAPCLCRHDAHVTHE